MAWTGTPLIDRRDFLRAAGASFAAAMAPRAWADTLAADAVFATAFVKRDGSFGAAVLSEAGKILHSIDLPDRGHDVTFDPVSKRSVVFARQPGTFAVVFDHAGRDKPLTIASITGRHFFGHGVFSPDGALLYATENDFDNAAGVVGVYDVKAKFSRIGEFPTYGMGPHELLLLGDGRTLAIANGGIETHPDYGRAELNIATMKPSYTLVDRVTGDLIEKHELPPALHQLSIRHMDRDQAGTVWFGCQYRGPANDRPALVGRAARGKELELLEMPQDVLSGFRNYIGSVAANAATGTVAVTSPEGNSLAVIDTAGGRVVATRSLVEVCGLAPDGAGFMATTGAGEIVGRAGDTRSEPDYVWDNHMLRIVATA
ncbi:DUF1513 domain-containing protein [Mesorhizobium sp. M2D.F.Ca.ET.185.01.1.1]|uniref:DUF1513 domain-containing protein n=1 Tax=unclassified Mesorhizobium TaxID=325217 RepID=UPI000FCA584B|nr:MULTISPECIES: DUF1513 domain-containing protein [unclassified Mesorhizobium]TGP51209.1 DUF1513 domain-containing protein [bacterium M00.F.Ca.ET.230.01.1.1]TGP78063.1 DUF1513 domain-containing protein [bacterium M00.F.Ca.ET.227.01.1.1]TGP88185.1 DUF1513 domain-containing protein [bacterium M00.F.Ca.ET.221.01.1.1]TGP93399.1 DUF1513 domain-containing protein [bacterium M00.F.Ca.ET.222.01.1.1]TGU13029.1 DUF1513 domain-containing protein [bacterium M00.F.Ca.ET.163.01.1.1]TGU31513.1 DUF1513 doma